MPDPRPPRKYAELVADWLGALGYTHCFFVAGGNIMHLLDGAHPVPHDVCALPFVHEVAAGIAVEYFNESGGEGRAFTLVTAGPGLTNVVTAMAGAFLESRELLVIGGQVKSTDLASGGLRQRGIQEIDGVAIAGPVTVTTARIERPVPRAEFEAHVLRGVSGRHGPVFIEICLDAQGAPVGEELETRAAARIAPTADASTGPAVAVSAIERLMREAERPIWLIGGGVTRAASAAARPYFEAAGVPIMTTWNGIDRVGADEPYYFGRPNTWGQRFANVLLQQADLIVAFGTRLGLQQTGFNWQAFAPKARVVQIDLDGSELEKGHPRVDVPLQADANSVLEGLDGQRYGPFSEWLEFCAEVKALLPIAEAGNVTGEGYISPYDFFLALSELATADDIVIPCSSGGANSVAMQTFLQKDGQVVITNKGLASMGYGLAGAIGAALAHSGRRVLAVEGDGGFAQNLQELATVAVNALNLKMFLMSNEGYASIRMTQRSHFGGHYLGCDTRTGLGFPDWPKLFSAFGIPTLELGPDWDTAREFRAALDRPGPHGFIIPVDPEQTYFPKIMSRVTATGGMESQPLHLMAPDLPDDLAARVLRYI